MIKLPHHKISNIFNCGIYRMLLIIENVDIQLLSMKYLISMILVTWLLNRMCPEQ